MKLLFAGDFRIRNVSTLQVSADLRKLIDSHDIKICNFEGSIAEKDARSVVKTGPAVYQSGQSAQLLSECGFNVVSLANNHIMDFGISSLVKTIKALNGQSISCIGAGCSHDEIYAPFIAEDSSRTAVLGVCQNDVGCYTSRSMKAGYAWILHPELRSVIADIKSRVSRLIIFVHAGLENAEYPLPEWRQTCQQLLDDGADMIIGAHPHTIQGHEIYTGKHIFYSLGNFLFESDSAVLNESADWNTSILVSIDTADFSRPAVYYVRADGNSLRFAGEDALGMVDTRSVLFDDPAEYEKYCDTLAEQVWNDFYESYYFAAVKNTFPSVSFRNMFRILGYLVRRKIKKDSRERVIDTSFLLHNLQIETHRWVVERYLRNHANRLNGFCAEEA